MKNENVTPTRDEARSYRSQRFAEIAAAFSRHGLGFFTDRLGLERFVPLQHGWLGHARRDDPYTEAEHVRLLVEDLGPVAIKFGQMLSARRDILPEEYLLELRKVQDHAPVDVSENPLDVISAEFGEAARGAFASLDETPIASASLGQAYEGVLTDGTAVIVKIRRPHVEARVAEDLGVLRDLASIAARRWHTNYDFIGLEEEFARTLHAELDYIREARSLERFAQIFADTQDVRVPKVFHELSSTRILTLERMNGMKLVDRRELEAAGVDTAALAMRVARMYLRMTLEEGFYHADPHPGNFFVEPSGTIELIDFGMTGNVDSTMRRALVRLFLAVQGNDVGRVVDALLDIDVTYGRIDRRALGRDIGSLLSDYYGRPVEEIGVGSLLGRIQDVVRIHGLRLPAELGLLIKTWIMVEGLVTMIDPSVSLAKLFAPYAQRLMAQEFSPGRAPELTKELLQEGMLALETLPQQARRILGDLERGSTSIGVRFESMDAFHELLHRLTNRIVAALILASFIPALAVLMLMYHPLNALRLSADAFAIGLLGVFILAAYLLWTTYRPSRR